MKEKLLLIRGRGIHHTFIQNAQESSHLAVNSAYYKGWAWKFRPGPERACQGAMLFQQTKDVRMGGPRPRARDLFALCIGHRFLKTNIKYSLLNISYRSPLTGDVHPISKIQAKPERLF
jgi:hypothetical protein